MRQVIIGTQGNQPFPIHDPKVSRRHAILNIGDNGQIQLIDNNSTNGTYVYNGAAFVRLYANQPCNVLPDSMIQLGPDTRFHVRRLLAAPQQQQQPHSLGGQGAGGGQPQQQQSTKKEPKKVDISKLRYVSEHYESEKMRLESKLGMINGFRSGTILISLSSAALGSYFTSEWAKFMPIIIALVLMLVLLGVINSFNKKLIKQRKDNEHDYAVNYVCPVCYVSFRGKVYENILAERSCPRCKAQYYDKNVKN